MTWQYRVVGFLNGDFGLAVAARNTVRALDASGRLAGEVDIQVLPPRRIVHQLRDAWVRRRTRKPVRRGPAASAPGQQVNLFEMNPLEVAWFSPQWEDAVSPGYNVCVPFWELPRVPRGWRAMLSSMDAVLAPTRFVQSACAGEAPSARVLHYPQAVFLPGGVTPDRSAWGLPRGATVFIVSFDLGSDIDRKNPWSAIQAFQKAFPPGADVRLVVKAKTWAGVHEYQAQLDRLRALVAGDPRIQVLDRSLPYADVLRLYASCDVMLALHRSEGLGLHLMEAMSLGAVVVGTNWSGNTDFMTPDNSVPVGYRLVPVRTSHSHYQSEVGRKGQVWAEADVEEAARALRMLHEDPERRRALGAAAARDMESRRASMTGGGAFAELEGVLGGVPRPAGLGGAVWRARAHAVARQIRAAIRDVRTRRLGW